MTMMFAILFIILLSKYFESGIVQIFLFLALWIWIILKPIIVA